MTPYFFALMLVLESTCGYESMCCNLRIQDCSYLFGLILQSLRFFGGHIVARAGTDRR